MCVRVSCSLADQTAGRVCAAKVLTGYDSLPAKGVVLLALAKEREFPIRSSLPMRKKEVYKAN